MNITKCIEGPPAGNNHRTFHPGPEQQPNFTSERKFSEEWRGLGKVLGLCVDRGMDLFGSKNAKYTT